MVLKTKGPLIKSGVTTPLIRVYLQVTPSRKSYTGFQGNPVREPPPEVHDPYRGPLKAIEAQRA